MRTAPRERFLANVSHEIRTPLSAIIGMAQLMRETGAQDDMLRRIQTSAESLMVIIGDILDFSKIESRKLTLAREPFPLRHTLADAVDILRLRAGEKHLELALEVLPDVPDALLGDPMRLRQVLINLIGNAVKFTEHGEVRLRVSIATDVPGEVCLHFAVIDTASAFPATSGTSCSRPSRRRTDRLRDDTAAPASACRSPPASSS